MSAAPRCFVYFIACSGFVKIGVARSVAERKATLQAANPFPLEVLGTIAFRGAREAFRWERALHAQFSADHVRGEWFHYGAALRAHVRKLDEKLGWAEVGPLDEAVRAAALADLRNLLDSDSSRATLNRGQRREAARARFQSTRELFPETNTSGGTAA